MDYRFMPKPRDERVDLVNKTHPIVKGRTYLKPGEESPEGSEEQEGPRGGRYYEAPEGEKPVSTHREPEIGEEKPSTIGDVVENIVSGDEEFNPAKYTNRSLVRLHALIGAEMDSGRRSEREKMWLGDARDSVATVLRTREGDDLAGQGGLGEAEEEEQDQRDVDEADTDTGGKREGYGGNRFMP